MGNKNGFDRIGIYKKMDGQKPLFILKKNQWSEKIYTTIKTKAGEKEVVFRIKLIELRW